MKEKYNRNQNTDDLLRLFGANFSKSCWIHQAIISVDKTDGGLLILPKDANLEKIVCYLTMQENAPWVAGQLQDMPCTSQKTIFDDSSITVDISDVPMSYLESVAEERCTTFALPGILIKAYNSKKIFYWSNGAIHP